jgi:hypothetical protein
MGFFPEMQAYLFLAIYGIIMPVGVAYTAAKGIRGMVSGFFGVILAITGGILAALLVSFISYGTIYLIVGVDILPEALALIAIAPSIAGAGAGVLLNR